MSLRCSPTNFVRQLLSTPTHPCSERLIRTTWCHASPTWVFWAVAAPNMSRIKGMCGCKKNTRFITYIFFIYLFIFVSFFTFRAFVHVRFLHLPVPQSGRILGSLRQGVSSHDHSVLELHTHHCGTSHNGLQPGGQVIAVRTQMDCQWPCHASWWDAG